MGSEIRRVQKAAPSSRRTLLGLGALFLAVAAAFVPEIAVRLGPLPAGLISPRLPDQLLRARLEVGTLGLALLGVALWVRSRPRLDERLARLGWLLVPVLLVVVAETVLRVYVPERARIFEPDAELGWKLKPGATGIWGGAEVSINANGLRGPERPRTKPAGTRRILALGDSVTFGFSVPYDDTFAARLEDALRARGEPVEVINAGVGGYSPWQHRVWLERDGLAYQPDLVVLSLTLNDVDEKFSLERFGGRFEGVQLMARDPPLLLRSGIVFSIWFPLFFDKQAAGRAPPWPTDLQDLHTADVVWNRDSPVVREGWRITLGNLQQLADVCRENGLPLLVVVFPFVVQLEEPGLDTVQRPFLEFAEHNDLPVLDLLPELRAAAGRLGVEPRELFLDMSHLSPLGARVVADRILEQIDAMGGAR